MNANLPGFIKFITRRKKNIRTPCSRVRLDQPTISQLVKQLPVFNQTRKLVSGNTKPVRRLSLYLHGLARLAARTTFRFGLASDGHNQKLRKKLASRTIRVYSLLCSSRAHAGPV
jgi:hypothetical protein